MTHMFRYAAPTPPAPGRVLKERLLDGLQLTQAELARTLGISCPRLNMIIKGRCQITAEVALRIERVFDISPQYWLRVRNEFELFEERRRISAELEMLPRLTARTQAEEKTVWRSDRWRAAA